MPLYRRLDEAHTMSVRRYYPHSSKSSKGYPHRAVLGVGGNVGDIGRRLEKLWIALRRETQLFPVRSGIILRNPPFGYCDQAAFENTVIMVATSLSPRALLRRLWRLEKRFGRIRSFPNAPRTLDLDIIFFDNRVMSYPELIVPHPHWRERISVVLPWRSLNYNASTRRRRYENLNV